MVDVDHEVFVARFVESGGVGVDGFFDVLFQARDRAIFFTMVEYSAAIERMQNGKVHARSMTYFYDAVDQHVMATKPENDVPMVLDINERVRELREEDLYWLEMA